MFRKVLFLWGVICIGLGSLVAREDRRGVAKYFDEIHFTDLLLRAPPQWMQEQLTKDFAPFLQEGISLKGVDEIYCRAREEAFYFRTSEDNLLRFRTIQGKVYAYTRFRGYDEVYQQYGRALAQLSLHDALPNVDIVIFSADSIMHPYMFRSFFWLTPADAKKHRGPAPILAKDKGGGHFGDGVVLIPDGSSLEQANNLINEMRVTSEKLHWGIKSNTAFWRGDPTDLQFYVPLEYHATYPKEFIQRVYSCRARYRICELSKKYPHLINAGYANFGGPFINGLQELIQPMIRGWVAPNEHLYSKYLPCLDGWACTYPGYLWRLASNSVVLKQETEHMQWFYHALKPYVHYIPIRKDLSDLLEKMEWAQAHDPECKIISQNASTFARGNLTNEHQLLYLHLVLKEYERLQRFTVDELEKDTECDVYWTKVW